MVSVEEFFAEQEKRMNMPDEDMDEYIRQHLEFRRNRTRILNLEENAPGIDSSGQTRNPRAELPRETALFTRDPKLSRTVAKEATVPSPSEPIHGYPGNPVHSPPASVKLQSGIRCDSLKRKSIHPAEFTAVDKRHKQEDLDGRFSVATVSPALPSRNESAEIPHEALISDARGKWASSSKAKSDQQHRFRERTEAAPVKARPLIPIVQAKPDNVNDLEISLYDVPNATHLPSRSLKAQHTINPVSGSSLRDPAKSACSPYSLVDGVVDTPLARAVASATVPSKARQDVSRSLNHSITRDQSINTKSIKSITATGSSITSIAQPGVNAASSRQSRIGKPSTRSAVDGGNTKATPFPEGPATIFSDHPSFAPQATSTQLPLPEHSNGEECFDIPEPLMIDPAEPRGTSVPQKISKTAFVDFSAITSPANTPIYTHKQTSSSSDIDTASRSSPIAESSKGKKAITGSKSDTSVSKPKTGKKLKEKAPLMTPLEYAQRLQAKFELDRPRKTDYLKGKCVFYVGGDMQFASPKTRGRMDYIVKHGGTLVPSYDPFVVTHIVTDATSRPTLRALGLKSLSAIPDHIPTVTWNWVLSGLRRWGRKSNGKGKEKADDDASDSGMDFEFMHAAFHERIDAGRKWKKSSGQRSEADFSRISEFTQERKASHGESSTVHLQVLPRAPLNLTALSEKPEKDATKEHGKGSADIPGKQVDPLADFYPKARADRDAAWGQGQDESDGDDESDGGVEDRRVPIPKRGFTCDKKEPQQRECINQDIIDKLQELMELHKAKPSDDDRWRAFSYGKCIRALRNYPKKITSFNQARAIRGVGEKTALKIMEIIETGNLRRIAYEKTDDVEATNIFQGIYGVGRSTAFMWYASGCRTLDDIKARKGGIKISTVQEIGIRFYDDINSRMPRSEAEKIFHLIKPIALEFDPNLFIEIMGSFRRGKADCGDIDILITRPNHDGKTHAGLLPELLAALHSANILTEDLSLPEDFSALELSYRGLCRLPEPGSRRRRIDILCVPWENRGAALLYYTGDDIFNRAMRMKANVLGYSLNQRGLYGGVVRDPRDRRVKVNEGNIVASETEEEIFKILGVPWQEPHERVRG